SYFKKKSLSRFSASTKPIISGPIDSILLAINWKVSVFPRAAFQHKTVMSDSISDECNRNLKSLSIQIKKSSAADPDKINLTLFGLTKSKIKKRFKNKRIG